MNEHQIPREDEAMADPTTTEEGVALLAEKFADAEEALVALARAIPKGLATVRDGAHIGGIECVALTAHGGTVVNGALSQVATLHQDWTKRADEKGIDLPAPRSGGGR